MSSMRRTKHWKERRWRRGHCFPFGFFLCPVPFSRLLLLCINPFNPLWKQIDLLTHSTSAASSMASFVSETNSILSFIIVLLCEAESLLRFQWISLHFLSSVTVILSVSVSVCLSSSQIDHRTFISLPLFFHPSYSLQDKNKSSEISLFFLALMEEDVFGLTYNWNLILPKDVHLQRMMSWQEWKPIQRNSLFLQLKSKAGKVATSIRKIAWRSEKKGMYFKTEEQQSF